MSVCTRMHACMQGHVNCTSRLPTWGTEKDDIKEFTKITFQGVKKSNYLFFEVRDKRKECCMVCSSKIPDPSKHLECTTQFRPMKRWPRGLRRQSINPLPASGSVGFDSCLRHTLVNPNAMDDMRKSCI